MSPHVVFSYVAVKPIKAEHPVGSGKIVDYEPGDVIPAGEWGRAADNLVELGKAAMMAINVPDDGEDWPSVGQLPDQAAPTGHGLSDPNHSYLNYEGVDRTQPVVAVEEEEPEPEPEEGDMSHSFPVQGKGGWWTLSDGSRVRGEDAAIAAEAALGG